jgi:hypothetical protein
VNPLTPAEIKRAQDGYRQDIAVGLAPASALAEFCQALGLTTIPREIDPRLSRAERRGDRRHLRTVRTK